MAVARKALSDRAVFRSNTLHAVVAYFELPITPGATRETGSGGSKWRIIRGVRVCHGDRTLASGPIAVVREQSGPRGRSCHKERKSHARLRFGLFGALYSSKLLRTILVIIEFTSEYDEILYSM